MNNTDSESLQRLQELRQKNSDRRNIIKELHHEYLLEVEDRRKQQHHGRNNLSADTLPKSVFLECELQQLQVMTPPLTQLPLRNSHDFGLELIESYQQLADTQTVLEHRIELEKKKFQQLNVSLTQQKQIRTTLNDIQQGQQSQSLLEIGEAHSDSMKDDREGGQSQSLLEENQWLRRELEYVAEQVEACKKKRSRPQSSVELRKKDGGHDEEGTNGDAPTEAGKKRYWSLDKVVLELLHQYLISPHEPYILADPLCSSIHPRHVELLQSCWVIERHEDNPNLIRITEYD